MKTPPPITDAEWDVMKVVWAEHPITGNAVSERLEPTRGWNPKTVKTLLTRLRNKGVVDFEKRGREFHYHPVVPEAACIQAASRSFMRRVFNGAVRPTLTTLIENEDLSDDDIRSLQGLLERKGKAQP